MKKKIYILLTSLLMLGCLKVNAASDCSYKEQAALNKEAANIKATYEEQIKYHRTEGCNMDSCSIVEYYFKISVLNLSKNFYVTVSNANDSSVEYLNYSSSNNGVISFDDRNITETNTYTFTIYSTSETSCPGEKYRTFTLKTPKYSEYIQCENNPEFEMCQKYVNYDIDFYDFNEKIEAYSEQKEEEEQKNNVSFIQRIFNFIDDNHNVIIIIVVITVLAGGAITIYILKKRKDQENEKM